MGVAKLKRDVPGFPHASCKYQIHRFFVFPSLGGLKHSSAPFSQYSERIEEGEEEGENGDPYISTASSIKGETSIEHAQSVQNHSATVHVKKRSSSKKTKPKKSFEECLEEVSS